MRTVPDEVIDLLNDALDEAYNEGYDEGHADAKFEALTSVVNAGRRLKEVLLAVCREPTHPFADLDVDDAVKRWEAVTEDY